MADRIDIEVVPVNLADLQAALSERAPAARRDLDKRLRTRIRQVAAGAAARVHSRSGETARGYRVATRPGSYKVVNKTRGAAILEFAAVPHCPQGAALVSTLNARYGAPGRIAWSTWDAQKDAVARDLRLIVADAERELDQAGG